MNFEAYSHRCQLVCSHLGQWAEVTSEIVSFAGSHKIWLLEGNLGAGKTTLIQFICRMLGVKDQVTSPTFSLVNQYALPTGEAVYHFDFYRLRKEEEAVDIGVEEYFYSGSYCFIEWGSQIARLIPPRRFLIHIQVASNLSRVIDLYRYD